MTHRPIKIVLVDDNKANLAILGATFEDNGYEVLPCSSVEEAQHVLTANSATIDLVVSDIQMPVLTGFDLVRWIKAQPGELSEIPVLLITSNLPEIENRITGLSLGAVDYLSRSLDPQELVLKAQHAIENFIRIKSLKSNLESTESLVSLGRIYAASTHEIKNVMQFIKFATNIMEREIAPLAQDLSDTYKQSFAMMRQSSDLLSELSKMIASLMSKEMMPLETIVLGPFLEKFIHLIQPLLKIPCTVDFNKSNTPSIQGSKTFLTQILINFLFNARDSILEHRLEQGGGEIKIDIECSSTQNISIVVRDNGVGFAAQESRETFVPFKSTKQLRGGTGLGLWLSSQLAEKMNAHISLSSTGVGQGATAKLIWGQ